MSGRPPPRPLVALAAAALIGQIAGVALEGGSVAAPIILGVGAFAFGLASRRATWPAHCWLAVGLLSLFATARDPGRPSAIDEVALLSGGSARGTWLPISRDRSIGRLKAFDGEPALRTHGIELVLRGGAPRSGEAIEILLHGTARPPAAGPASDPAPIARALVAADAWRRLDSSPPTRVRRALVRARRAVELRLDPIERGAGRSGLLDALILGNARALPFETRDLFTRTGARHLLAISGLHVGLAALGLAFLFERGGGTLRRRCVAVLTVLVLVAWALLSGAAPPVRRAALTLSAARLAVCLPFARGRFGALEQRVCGRSLLALALLVELVRDPRAVESTSVQLSYGATGALVFAAGSWTRWFRSLLPRCSTGWSTLGAGPCSRAVRALVDRTAASVATALAASFVASIATLPVLWITFGETSWASIPATPLALPPLAGVLAGGFAGLLGLPGATTLVRVSADVLVWLLSWFDSLPGTPSLLAPRPAWAIVVVCIGGLALPRLSLRLRVAWCLAAIALCLPRREPATMLEIHALDVGNGTAIVLRSPEVEAVVFDAGSRDRRRVWSDALAPLLAAWEVRETHVVLSHEHLDHRAALPALVTRTRCASLGGRAEGAVERWLDDDALRWDGDGARLDVGDLQLELVRGSDLDGNEGSRSLIVRWAGRSVLFSGDAEGVGLARSLEHGRLDGPFDLVLVPHHGSEMRLLGAFLAHTEPARVWISGSGDVPIASELERRGLAWAATGRSGPLSCTLTPKEP